MDQLISTPFGVWAGFFVLAMTILFAGYYLSVSGDVIAEKTGMGGSVVGLVLVATVTSLPELVTGTSAVVFNDLPDLATSGVLGSCTFNLLIIVVLDVFFRKETVYRISSKTHLYAGFFGILLVFIVLTGIWFPELAKFELFGPFGIHTPIIVIAYLWSMKKLFKYEKEIETKLAVEASLVLDPNEMSLKKASWIYAVASVFVIAAGLGLPFVGERIIAVMEWNEAFVGTMFIAFATSLPELAVTLSSIQIGAIDMAMANVLGSNMFNMLAISVYDIAYLKGPILSFVSTNNNFTGITAIAMTSLVIVGVKTRAGRVFGLVSWVSIAMVILYCLNTVLIY